MSLRDRLRQRQLPHTTVSLRVDFSPEADLAEQELRNALLELSVAQANGQDVTEVDTRVVAAQAAVDRCFEQLTVNALPPADMEALVAAHPPTPAQRQQDPSVAWNETTFRPAILAACVQGDLTEDDWAELITKGVFTLGEVKALVNAVMVVNDRSPDVLVGKGSTPNRN